MSDPLLVVDPLALVSPAAQYPLGTRSTARLIRTMKPAGVDWLLDHPPYAFLKVPHPLPITSLQTFEHGEWQTWMVDEPAQWIMMQALADRVIGPTVCITGLGLGLILHALVNRADIHSIIVVEQNPDVIALIGPLIPTRPHQTLAYWPGDFWDVIASIQMHQIRTFVVDLWRGPLPDNTTDVLRRRQELEARYPWPKFHSLFFAYQSLIDRTRQEEGLSHG